jgi:hypothetical protein
MAGKWVSIKSAFTVLVILSGSVGQAAEVSWIPGRSSPSTWSIQPAAPGETDVIRFSGPTRSYLNRSLAERAFGGRPVLEVDGVTRNIELRFELPASQSVGSFWDPVSGLQGAFGPLEKGQWLLFSTHPDADFSLSFQVGTGTGGAGVQVLYVDARASGANNGVGWVNAFVHLQDALAVATAGTEIRVAQGVYTPDKGGDLEAEDLTASFALESGVVLKGSYAGLQEREPNKRDIMAYETVLSGDLLGNDGLLVHPYSMIGDPNRYDNSYHVVTAVGTDATAVLDGFTITGGHAFGSHEPDRLSCGGGIYNEGGSPTIRDCLIYGNAVRHYGGGVYSRSMCAPTFINCIIADNWSEWWGGGIMNDGSDISMIRCLISGNGAGYHGGGIRNHTNGELILSNCILSGNVATEPVWGRGGGLYCYGAMARLDHCTLVGNAAVRGPSVACESPKQIDSPQQMAPSDVRVGNCILWDVNDPNGGIWNGDGSGVTIAYSDVRGGWVGPGNIDMDPCFVDAGHWDLAGTPGNRNDDTWFEGDYRLRWDSPCVDAGNPSTIPDAGATDFAGQARLWGAAVDMGAYELKNEAPVANAGPDVPGFSVTGDVGTVTLDASRSYDPEGLPLSYQWYREGQLASTQAKFTMELPLGEYVFTLIVNDGINDSAPDDVRATVTNLTGAAVMVSPSEMTRGKEGPIIAVVTLPKGRRVSEIEGSERLLLFPGGVKAVSQSLFVWLTGQAVVMARFDRSTVMAAIPDNGRVELRVVGKFKNGQYFSGTDTVRIK